MVREVELNLTVAQALNPETFTVIIAQHTGIQQSEIWGLDILKRSVDARKRPVSIILNSDFIFKKSRRLKQP